jgi:hypothetical protein
VTLETILYAIAAAVAAVALALFWSRRLHIFASVCAGGVLLYAGLDPIASGVCAAALLAIALVTKPPQRILVGAVIALALVALGLALHKSFPPSSAPPASPPAPAPAPSSSLPIGIRVLPDPEPTGCPRPLARKGDVLAVLNLAGRGAGFKDRRNLARQLRGLARKWMPAPKIITEENIQVLLAAQGKALEECEGACEVETGRRLGADVIVSGDISRRGAELSIFLSAHRTKDGDFVGSFSAAGPNIAALAAALPALSRKLFCGGR